MPRDGRLIEVVDTRKALAHDLPARHHRLLLAAGLSVAMLAVVASFALQLIRHWGPFGSGSERQLRPRAPGPTLSMMVALVRGCGAVDAAVQFNADRMSVMFVGAMCAVGTLNANAYGFPALYAQLVAFFFAATWLAINRPTTRRARLSATRAGHRLLLAYALLPRRCCTSQFNPFICLEADVITAAAACSREWRSTR